MAEILETLIVKLLADDGDLEKQLKDIVTQAKTYGQQASKAFSGAAKLSASSASGSQNGIAKQASNTKKEIDSAAASIKAYTNQVRGLIAARKSGEISAESATSSLKVLDSALVGLTGSVNQDSAAWKTAQQTILAARMDLERVNKVTKALTAEQLAAKAATEAQATAFQKQQAEVKRLLNTFELLKSKRTLGLIDTSQFGSGLEKARADLIKLSQAFKPASTESTRLLNAAAGAERELAKLSRESLNAAIGLKKLQDAFSKTQAAEAAKQLSDYRTKLRNLDAEVRRGAVGANAGAKAFDALTKEMVQQRGLLNPLSKGYEQLSVQISRSASSADRLRGKVNGLSFANQIRGANGFASSMRVLQGEIALFVSALGINRLVRGLNDASESYYSAVIAQRLYDRELQKSGTSIEAGTRTVKALAAELRTTDDVIQNGAVQLLRYGATIEQAEVLMRSGAASGLAFGRTVADGVEAIAQAIVGEQSQILNRIGIAGNLSTAYRDYARDLGTTTEQLTQQQKVQAALNMILRETASEIEALPVLFDGLAGAKNRFSVASTLASRAVGQEFEPALTALYNAGADVLILFTDNLVPVLAQHFNPLIENSVDNLTNFITRLTDSSQAGIELRAEMAATTTVLLTIGEGFLIAGTYAFGFVTDVLGGFAGIGAAIGTVSVQFENFVGGMSRGGLAISRLLSPDPVQRSFGIMDLAALKEEGFLKSSAFNFDEIINSAARAQEDYRKSAQGSYDTAAASIERLTNLGPNVEAFFASMTEGGGDGVQNALSTLVDINSVVEDMDGSTSGTTKKIRTFNDALADYRQGLNEINLTYDVTGDKQKALEEQLKLTESSFKELVSLALSDGVLSDSERSTVQLFADDLGVLEQALKDYAIQLENIARIPLADKLRGEYERSIFLNSPITQTPVSAGVLGAQQAASIRNSLASLSLDQKTLDANNERAKQLLEEAENVKELEASYGDFVDTLGRLNALSARQAEKNANTLNSGQITYYVNQSLASLSLDDRTLDANAKKVELQKQEKQAVEDLTIAYGDFVDTLGRLNALSVRQAETDKARYESALAEIVVPREALASLSLDQKTLDANAEYVAQLDAEAEEIKELTIAYDDFSSTLAELNRISAQAAKNNANRQENTPSLDFIFGGSGATTIAPQFQPKEYKETVEALQNIAKAADIANKILSTDFYNGNSIIETYYTVAADLAELIPVIGPALSSALRAVGTVINAVIGDLSNGIKQIKEELDTLDKSNPLLSRDLIQAIADQNTIRVSRGGITGFFGATKAELEREGFEQGISIASSIATGIAQGLTNADFNFADFFDNLIIQLKAEAIVNLPATQKFILDYTLLLQKIFEDGIVTAAEQAQLDAFETTFGDYLDKQRETLGLPPSSTSSTTSTSDSIQTNPLQFGNSPSAISFAVNSDFLEGSRNMNKAALLLIDVFGGAGVPDMNVTTTGPDYAAFTTTQRNLNETYSKVITMYNRVLDEGFKFDFGSGATQNTNSLTARKR